MVTLEVSLTEFFNLLSKSLKSLKISIDVDYESSEDAKEIHRVDR